jgi:hypothetical protein
MGVAQPDADVEVAEQVIHGHDVHAALGEPRGKRMAEHVLRHLPERGALRSTFRLGAMNKNAGAGPRALVRRFDAGSGNGNTV